MDGSFFAKGVSDYPQLMGCGSPYLSTGLYKYFLVPSSHGYRIYAGPHLLRGARRSSRHISDNGNRCLPIGIWSRSLAEGGYIAGLYFETDIFNKTIYFLNQFNPLRGIYGYSIAYFLVGMYIEGLDYRPKIIHFGAISLLSCIVSPVGLAMYKVICDKLTNGSYDPVFGGYSCVSALILTVSLYYMAGILADKLPNCGSVSAAIKYLGANTFAVYLLHMFARPFITTAVQSVWPAWAVTAVSVLLAMSAVVVLAVVGSLLHRTRIGSWLLTV